MVVEATSNMKSVVETTSGYRIEGVKALLQDYASIRNMFWGGIHDLDKLLWTSIYPILPYLSIRNAVIFLSGIFGGAKLNKLNKLVPFYVMVWSKGQPEHDQLGMLQVSIQGPIGSGWLVQHRSTPYNVHTHDTDWCKVPLTHDAIDNRIYTFARELN